MSPDALSGCAACLDASADDAWTHRSSLAQTVRIADESHFIVSILRCGACGQRFASVFCETIDWSGGDDAQDSLLVPVSAAEADALVVAGADGVEGLLRALAPERRYLVRSFPRDAAAPAARFVTGRVWIPLHD